MSTTDKHPEIEYGVLCMGPDGKFFITWFNTTEKDKAERLMRCITDNKNSLVGKFKFT